MFKIGFDPALPLFNYNNVTERLASTDALFVDVIHTCAGLLGYDLPIGQVDFYPNGGDHIQPGCGFDPTGDFF
jgi:pancreatic triacylglycerol lipase